MKKIYLLLLYVFCAATLFLGCKKDKDDKNTLVKTISDNSDNRILFYYNKDNSLSQIIDQTSFKGSSTPNVSRDKIQLFGYSSTKLTSISSEQLVESIAYEGNGRIKTVDHKLPGQSKIFESYRFTYDGSGNPLQMEWLVDTLGKLEPRWIYTYEYNLRGQIGKITAEDTHDPMGGGIYTISLYSEECSFNPWAIYKTHPVLHLHPAVLLTFKQLPATISFKSKDGLISDTDQITYYITNKRVDGITHKYLHNGVVSSINAYNFYY